MIATYTKLKNGEWGIRIEGADAALAGSGVKATVRKRSGEEKIEEIGRVLWEGQDRNSGRPVALCTIAKGAPATSASTIHTSERGCRSCARAKRGGYLRQHLFDGCDECGNEQDW